MAREATDESDESFLEQIAEMDHTYWFLNVETLKMYNDPMLSRYTIGEREEGDFQFEGRHLCGGVVKHYSHTDVFEFLDHKQRNCEIARIKYGSLFKAILTYDGLEKSVTIKTWKLSYPPKEMYYLYPTMLYNDIMITSTLIKRRPNVAKLIGYTIDRVLAVVYDLSPLCTLYQALSGYSESSSQFGWKHRLKVAIGIGRAIQSFHEDNIVVGCIDANCMLLDQEFTVYLCDFRLQPYVENMVSDRLKDLLPVRYEGYGIYAPELGDRRFPEDFNFDGTLERDIYSYGMLLLTMITKEMRAQMYNTWSRIDTNDGLSNLVESSFLEAEHSEGKELTSFLKRCLNEDPQSRPKAQDVVTYLEALEEKCGLGNMDKMARV